MIKNSRIDGQPSACGVATFAIPPKLVVVRIFMTVSAGAKCNILKLSIILIFRIFVVLYNGMTLSTRYAPVTAEKLKLSRGVAEFFGRLPR